MNSKTGLWIDHRIAIIVAITDNNEKITHIESHVEKQQGRINGQRSVTPFELQLQKADDSQQKAYTKHLKTFYDAVLAAIGDADSILILGPGEAKGELKKLMEQNKHCNRVVAMESADKMTDRQISAKVHDFFASIKVGKAQSEGKNQ